MPSGHPENYTSLTDVTLEGEDWQFDPLVSAHPIGGYHHMGTTRMSDSPHEGVTDSYGRVHGIENLSIAGSSLFLTSGWANPTLTIIALACRTAAAIVEGLKAGEKTRSGMVIEAERTR